MRRLLSLSFLLLASAVAAPASAGTFAVTCPFADPPGFAPIDPIVKYKGFSAHTHVFKGNRTVTSTSTYASLRTATSAQSTCRRSVDTLLPGHGDLSAYWVPALMRRDITGNVTPIPIVTNATYYSAKHYKPSEVQPIPPGMKMLAGNSKATSLQPSSRIAWACTSGTLVRQPWGPECLGTTSNALRLTARFPSCWDGTVPSDAAVTGAPGNYDDSAHLAYAKAVNGNNASPWTCPADFPIPIPELLLIIDFQTRGGPDVFLEGDYAQYGEHADFFEAWDPVVMNKLMVSCIRKAATANCNHGDQPQ